MAFGGIVEIDLHNKNQYQARISIDAALRRANKSVYRIRLIHGCTHGTVLRDMVRAEYGAHPGVLRIEGTENGAKTDLVLREFV